MTRPIKRNEAIILILFLIAIFCFAWFLNRSCRRAVDAEMHEMAHRRQKREERERE
jgi:Tfp pilus assembly protein PilE